MIAATVLAILIIFGGGGGLFGGLTTEYVEDPLEDTITDKNRRELALNELDLLEDAIEDFNKNISEDVERFDELVKNYNSTPEAFDQMISADFARRKQEIENIWKHRSAMLAHINADEWQTIIKKAKAEAEEDKK